MDIATYRKFIKYKQSQIKFESDEDEGAAEFYGELQSIIDVIDKGGSIPDIKKAAEWVGEQCPL